MAKNKKQVVTGIDVGTTKICSTVAQLEGSEIRILGTGWAASKGLKKGVVISLSETIQSVRDSLEEAEKESQSIVESAYVSVGGSHIEGINCSGEANVRG
ncbi:MAG: cell division protein FtsA, partial [Acidobacteriota bacterium]